MREVYFTMEVSRKRVNICSLVGAGRIEPMAFFGTTATSSASTEPKDAELVDPPSDSISSLAFSSAPQSDYLAVGSWDNQVIVHLPEAIAHQNSLAHRCEYTKSTTKARAKERPPIPMKVPSWMSVGTRMAPGSSLEV
jgi:hypothetical protein